MTTKAVLGYPFVVYNPHDKPVDELPVVYGFNNGGSPGWHYAVAISEDGFNLGEHICSHEAFMPADLGVIEGTRSDRHDNSYRKHYPDGYRMDFVPYENISEHVGLQAAIKAVRDRQAKENTDD